MIFYLKFFVGVLVDCFHSPIELCDMALHYLNYSAETCDRRSIWLRLLFLPLSILLFTFRALLSMLLIPFWGFTSEIWWREKNFYMGIPAIFGLIVCLVGLSTSLFMRGQVRDRYKAQMLTAMNSGEFQLASMIGSRLMEESATSDPELTYTYAMALGRNGEQARALGMIQSLAPDDKPGYAPAHRSIALGMLPSLQKEVPADVLTKLRFHLDHCHDDQSVEVRTAWAFYYVRAGQLDQAIKSLESLPKLEVGSILLLSDLYAAQKNTAASIRGWQRAREELEKKLTREPQDANAALLLAQVLGKLGDLDAVEKVLGTSLKVSQDERVKTSLAQVYLIRNDMAMNNKAPIQDRLQFIRSALVLAPNMQAGYDRLIDLCAANPKSDETAEVKQQLEEMIVDGKNASFAHFALSSILVASSDVLSSDVLSSDVLSSDAPSDAPDKARWHLEQALALDSSLTVVANNLAWILAHSDPKKLDEAENLSRRALAAQDTPVFHDTLGTILLYQEKYTDAARELELALKGGFNNREIHAKLAKVYQELGNESLAKLHAQRASP